MKNASVVCLASLVTCAVALSPIASAQSLVDPNLRVVRYASGFDNPTGIAFLDSNGTALVTEKTTGRVKLLQNRGVTKTVLDLPVANDGERGLLSIALSPGFATDHLVYFYHTAATTDGGSAISNNVSRYLWNPTAQTLTLDRNIIDLPATVSNHNGGKILFGPDNRLFGVIGDQGRRERTGNIEASNQLSRTGIIFHLQPDGRRVTTNPFASSSISPKSPLQDIYAYGVRNSFGLAFDPITRDLWDTENGPNRMDEINRVLPGQNSGWLDIMGPVSRSGTDTSGLVSLGSRAIYQDPKMAWDKTIAPTDLEFLSNSHLGASYRNDLFVGDVNTGSLFHFDLTSNRKSLQLTGALSDRVADNTANVLDESDQLIFGSGFGITTDIVSGPGGMYVLSLSNGVLYRISEVVSSPGATTHTVPEPAGAMGLLGVGTLLNGRVRSRRDSGSN